MKERLLEFLKNENKSSAQLAEEIGVQASGISHILSGRNNPSLDFVMKMLEKYQFLSTDWLLFGKGSMYKDAKMHNLFDNEILNSEETYENITNKEIINPKTEYQEVIKSKKERESEPFINPSDPKVVKIIWFYENKSFEEFFPRR